VKRRDFVRTGLVSAAAVAVNAPGLGAQPTVAAPFKLKYAPHFGMFKESAGDDVVAQLRFMADQGFTAMEDNGLMGRPVAEQERIGAELARLKMTMGVFVLNAYRNGDVSLVTGKPEVLERLTASARTAVDVAKRVNAKWITIVPGNYDRRIPIGIQTANVVEAMRRISEIFEPHGLVFVMEPLSDSPDLFLRVPDQAYEICRAVDSPACKILYDMYHVQRNQGNIIPTMDAVWSEIGYVQIGDNPGRKEPTSGEVNYRNIFKHLHGKGYQGVLGMEHGNSKPGKEGEQAVIEAYRWSDGF
jgi:hydroxypyruvate isomerase